jgi:predicted Zn-dependent protease
MHRLSKHAGFSLATASALTLAIFLSACASNPTGGSNFVLMTENRELEIGKEEHEKIMKSVPVYRDAKLQAYIDRIGQKMAAVSDRPELTYTFTVIDSPDINAFALPGGYIYVNRGLLTFLTSEAQMAAVIGHEIGHVTGRHAVRQQTAARTGKVLSTAVTVASIFATGTNVLGDTADLFGGALISGYGREMELEADELGAEYMYRAGYDPSAVLEVIGVLKNHEDFMKKVSNRGPAYHGLFATHPRNDTRLQQAVGKVGTLDQSKLATVDPADFRNNTQGIIVGPSAQNLAGVESRNRYYQSLLNYTMVFPQDWSWSETTTTLNASAPEEKASLLVEVQRLQQNKEPRLFLREDLGIPELQQSEALNQFGLSGWTGLHPDGGNRIAVIYHSGRAFIFTATIADEAQNANIVESIKSFRPIARNEGVFANPLQVEWIQSNGRETYAQLARRTRIPDYAEETLRLMNGDYPVGEPKAGEWIKLTN